MAKCKDCGEPVQFLENGNGKLAPYDLEPRLHYANPKHQAAMKRKKVDDGDRTGNLAERVPAIPRVRHSRAGRPEPPQVIFGAHSDVTDEERKKLEERIAQALREEQR